MPIYILKRYHKVYPTNESIWHLGREAAFHAPSDAKAIAFAQKQDGSDLAPHGGLAILLDPRGRHLWETVFENPTVNRRATGSEPVSTAVGNATPC